MLEYGREEPEIYDHENRWDASDSDDGTERFRGGKNRSPEKKSIQKKKTKTDKQKARIVLFKT